MPDLAGSSPRGRKRPRPLLRTTLGGALRRARLAQDRTLADVAGAAQVSLAYLSELERGRKEASSEILAAVCDALRIELSDLLAAVWRDLAADRAGRATVVRLADIRERHPGIRQDHAGIPADQGGTGGQQAAVRGDRAVIPGGRAVIRGDQADIRGGQAGPRPRGPGDALCLAA